MPLSPDALAAYLAELDTVLADLKRQRAQLDADIEALLKVRALFIELRPGDSA